MAFASTLSVNNAAAAAKSFVLNYLQANSSERIETTSTLTSPVKLLVRHTFVKGVMPNAAKGIVSKDGYDRHALTFSKTVTDTDDLQHTCSVTITLTVPRVTDLTRADVNDMLAYARNFTGVTANVDALLLNES